MIPPLAFNWDGEALVPRVPRLADKHLVVGETYMMVPHEDRSDATHKHEFAWLREAWMNLPEDIAVDYPTAEHLRKRALIEAGFCDETIVDAGSKAAALRTAAFVRAIDDFAMVFVKDQFVIRRTAKSQSRRAMKKDEFQASKTAIMEIISNMIGVTPDALQRARAA
jgi:hypothetical protein